MTSTSWVRTHPAYRAIVSGWPEQAILACSGGVDSSALLVLAGIGVQRQDINPFLVVHVDHRTRPESALEGGVVAALASRFALVSIRTSVTNDTEAPFGRSPEEHLRTLRYGALARVAKEHDIADVVTAHTQDDQVETVLMRLLGGAGGVAMAGMLPIVPMTTNYGTIHIHRPLLDIPRRFLADVLDRCGIEPIVDPSNVDTVYRRNQVRHDLVPLMQRIFPGYESALIRSVKLAARDADALDEISQTIAHSISTLTDNRVCLDRVELKSLHPALATRVIRLAAASLMPENHRELTFERVEAVRSAVTGRSGARVELPYGVVARVERTEVVLERRNEDHVS